MAHNPCGTSDANQRLTVEVLKNLFWRGESLLGPAVFAAKCSLITWYPTNDNYYGPAVLWTLFGDPALRVRHGTATALSEQPGAPAEGVSLRTFGTRVVYTQPSPGRVSLRFYDLGGALVEEQLATWQAAGRHATTIGANRPNGVHFVELVFRPDGATPLRFVRKLTLVSGH